MSFCFKLAPGGADQSLQVSRFSIIQKILSKKNDAYLGQNRPKMAKMGYALNKKVA